MSVDATTKNEKENLVKIITVNSSRNTYMDLQLQMTLALFLLWPLVTDAYSWNQGKWTCSHDLKDVCLSTERLLRFKDQAQKKIDFLHIWYYDTFDSMLANNADVVKTPTYMLTSLQLHFVVKFRSCVKIRDKSGSWELCKQPIAEHQYNILNCVHCLSLV